VTEPRLTADTITDDQLDALYAERDQLRADLTRFEEETVGELNEQNTTLARQAAQAESALARVRDIANELISTGASWDGNEPGAGRRILAALDAPKET